MACHCALEIFLCAGVSSNAFFERCVLDVVNGFVVCRWPCHITINSGKGTRAGGEVHSKKRRFCAVFFFGGGFVV